MYDYANKVSQSVRMNECKTDCTTELQAMS